jgi:hypothetical protein
MTDDLTKAYSSIYKKEEESKPEQVQEIVGAVLGAATALNAANTVRKIITPKKKPTTTTTTTTNEDVAITHLDGSTTEVVDVVKTEPLGNPDDKLASRLWDQVAANLDTLGEMYGASFDVVELEEKKKEKKLDPVGKEDEDVDNDGDVDDSDSYIKNKRDAIGKAMGKKKGKDMKEEAEQIDEVDCWDTHKKVGMKKKGGKMVNDCRPKNEGFNVKSPVVFSKPEEKTEEAISEETVEKYASSISKAHKAIKK